MTAHNSEPYIPYESVALSEVEDDVSVESFVRSLFPYATEVEVDKFRHYVSGKIHDGIQVGLELSQRQPMQPIEAYRMGIEDEQERARQERQIMEEGEE